MRIRIRLVSVVLFFALTMVLTASVEAGDFKTADAELNKVWRAVTKAYKDKPIFIKKLKIAQRAWLKFRDAHLESLYPAEDKQFAYGTVYSQCAALVLAALTEQRTDQLRVWLQGTEEGDVCAGSVKQPDELRRKK